MSGSGGTFLADDNHLLRHNDEVLRATVARRDELLASRSRARAAPVAVDPLGALKEKLRRLLRATSGLADLEVQFDLVERGRHHADLALKFPGLLKHGGPKAFVAHHRDRIVDALTIAELDEVSSVSPVGMYVNLTLSDAWLLRASAMVIEAGERYGTSTVLADERFVVDYSSPNMGKALHAGHIRSTIIGDTLSNLLEAAGSLVFRVNHINDFGGFGFLLEGHRRYHDQLAGLSLNERSLELYWLRRALERAVGAGQSVADLSAQDALRMARLLPTKGSAADLSREFAELTEAADRRFAALEEGEADEVAQWRELVDASLDDVRSFYSSLAVDIPFVLGESLYAQVGLRMVDEWLLRAAVIAYSESDAESDIEQLTQAHQRSEISGVELETLTRAVGKDVGAVVVRLSPAERFVVRRADGRSIYATRDLAAVKVRGELFDPTCCIYVVGQEQQSHFSRLFAASYQLGLADPTRMSFEHLSHGFYVDPHTHKKLSSRDSAAGVAGLFRVAHDYFTTRGGVRPTGPGNEAGDEDEDVPGQLTIASVVFNDLKQDVRSSVEMETDRVAAVVESFERSGGPYVVYSACRAGSVVRKAAGRDASPSQCDKALDGSDARLIAEVLTYPAVVVASARNRDPSMLVRYLLSLSNAYNSYYNTRRVLVEDGVVSSALTITAAVEYTLRNGLRLVNVDCPTSI